jgi:2-alkenal reductase
VQITVTLATPTGGLGRPITGSGSGFLIDREGHIVTNHHVVDGAERFTVRLSDGRTLPATRLGSSPADDLAVLQVDASEVSDIDPLTLADSSEVRPGQLALAVGSPFQNFNSVTVGVVSGTGRGPASVLRRPIPDMIQTDAALNPGNSGGPLLNSDGEVIGVNSSIRTSSTAVEDFRIGFAVPSNTLKDLLPRLLRSERVRRPWLGVSGSSVTPELGESLDVPKGVYIAGVFSGSPADEVGLRPFRAFTIGGRGDVITAVDGEPVESMEQIVGYFNTQEPGTEVILSIYRDANIIEVAVTLAEWPDT